jgi:hypothetical protein
LTEHFIFACLNLTVNFWANSFHMFNFQFLREHSHENLVFASSYFIFSKRSCRKASFSHLHLWAYEDIRTKTSFSHLHMSAFHGGLARKLRFHILNLQRFGELSHENLLFRNWNCSSIIATRFWVFADSFSASLPYISF